MFRKQQHSLVALALLFAVVVAGLAGYTLYSERQRVLRAAEAQAEAGALFSAAYTGRTYEVAAHLIEDAVRYIERERPSRAELRAFLVQQTASSPTGEHFVVTDAQGRLVLSSDPRATRDTDFSDREWFQGVAKGAESVIGPVLKSRISGEVLWTLARRLEDDQGRFTGAIAVGGLAFGVSPAAVRPPGEPSATVWNRDGRMVAATYVDFDETGRAIAPGPAPPEIRAVLPGVTAAGDAIRGYSPVPGWPLVSVVAYDKAGVLAAWRQELFAVSAVVLVALFGSAYLVWAGARSARREAEARAELTRAIQQTETALAQRDLLLKEVHHRVKNSLMMTASLLGLQARSFEDPRVRAAFDQTRARLSSISLVHESLYAGDGSEVDIAQYLPRLLHEIAHAHGADERRIGITIDIEPMVLPAERATLVGLIVSEVVSNAFKHAFPDVSGNIRVEGFCSPTGAAEICVHDDGVGYAASKDGAHGLGTKLIRVLAEQLDARFSFANEQGATFRLSFLTHGDPRASAPAAEGQMAPQA